MRVALRLLASGIGLAVVVVAGAGAQGVPTNPAEGCRSIGLFVFDVRATPDPKITVTPQRLVVSYPKAGETDREVCFAVVIVNGDKNDRFEQLNLKVAKPVLGRGGKPLFKVKKVHPASADLISFEFDDVPDWDPNADGVLEDVVQAYDIEAKFKGRTVAVDPEIVIGKPGG